MLELIDAEESVEQALSMAAADGPVVVHETSDSE